MTARSSARRSAVAFEPEGLNLSKVSIPPATADPASCPLCFVIGMEVVAGKGCGAAAAVLAMLRGSDLKRHAFRAATLGARSQTTTMPEAVEFLPP